MPWSQAAGLRFYYEDAGQGPVLVFLHGLGGSSADWESQIEEFRRDHRVIAPDLRGFGLSERCGPYTVMRFAADVWALLDELDVTGFVLIGHSMGGAVAMEMTLQRPSSVKRLVLSNTVPDFRPRSRAHRLMIWSRLLLMTVLGPGRLGRRSAALLYPGPELSLLRDRAGERSARNQRWPYLASLRNLCRWTALPRLKTLSLPILVMAAELDYLGIESERDFIDHLPPGVESQVFANTRHGLPLEAPQRFNQRLRQFLERA